MDGSATAAFISVAERDDVHAGNFSEMRRRLRLIEGGMRSLSCTSSGGWILVDRNGCVINADARAAQLLSTIGIDIDGESRLGGEAPDVQTSKRPEWLRAARSEPVVVGGERLGTLYMLPATVTCGDESGTSALPRYKVRRVVDFIDAHIDQPIRLEHLSAAAAVSPFYFHRQFKKSTGMTPHQYVVRMRIKRAQALLAKSSLPLVEVAARVGFSDQSQFTNKFRKLTSMTPKAYRNAVLDGIVRPEELDSAAA